MAQNGADLQTIKKLIEIMRENDLLEVDIKLVGVEVKHGNEKILLKRSQSLGPTVNVVPMAGGKTSSAPAGPGAAKVSVQSTASCSPHAGNIVEIKSRIVGTFYAQPSPESPPFVEIGSNVTPQKVVCIIEAMKVMNEVRAETTGTIAEVMVANGQSVEYGQVLFKVKPGR